MLKPAPWMPMPDVPLARGTVAIVTGEGLLPTVEPPEPGRRSGKRPERSGTGTGVGVGFGRGPVTVEGAGTVGFAVTVTLGSPGPAALTARTWPSSDVPLVRPSMVKGLVAEFGSRARHVVPPSREYL